MDLGNTAVELTCPGCSFKFKEQLRRLQSDPTINCPGCHQPIKINAAGLRSGLKKADQSLANFARKISGLGKRR